ncbi:hypothetical protein BGK51_24455, partial [Shigella sp. FC569]
DAQTVAALAKIDPDVTKEYARISGNIDQLNKDTTFAIDANGNITLDETGSVDWPPESPDNQYHLNK